MLKVLIFLVILYQFTEHLAVSHTKKNSYRIKLKHKVENLPADDNFEPINGVYHDQVEKNCKNNGSKDHKGKKNEATAYNIVHNDKYRNGDNHIDGENNQDTDHEEGTGEPGEEYGDQEGDNDDVAEEDSHHEGENESNDHEADNGHLKQKYRYIVGLLQMPASTHFCDGLILSSLHVLTLASCLCDWNKHKDPNEILVQSQSIIADPNTYQVKETLCHPEYNNETDEVHNIGLLGIDRAFDFDERVSKYRIDLDNTKALSTLKLFKVIAAVYDTTRAKHKFLNQFFVLILHKVVCEVGTYPMLTEVHHITKLNEWNVCSILTHGEYGDICYHRPGSPILYKAKLVGMLAGAICSKDIGPLYVIIDVSYHHKWIIEASGTLFHKLGMTPSDW